MSDLREQIKKQCFGLDDDELDTQIAYRDILDVVGKIEALIQEQVIAELNKLSVYRETNDKVDVDFIDWQIIENRIKELKK